MLTNKPLCHDCGVCYQLLPKLKVKGRGTDSCFVRSGYIYPAWPAGTFGLAGFFGYEWSSRTSPTSSSLSYWFEFSATESRPSYGPNNRYNGLPLRCLMFLPRWVPIFKTKKLP